MVSRWRFPTRKINAREKRWLFYLFVVLAFAAWRFVPRPWNPTVTIETPHYTISSTAAREHVEEIGRVVEILYVGYSNRLGTLPRFQREHPRLKLLLYKDRNEMRRINPGLGWAEAFYRKPYCRAYYSATETNPYHWMLHEAVHQLNEEVAHLNLAKWLEEGIAEYFSASRIETNRLALGRIDPNTYPIWWIDEIATAPQLDANLKNGSVIPLRQIISGNGGPLMRTHFNLYYLHWWSLTYFIFESPAHASAAQKLLEQGGGVEAFERLIGPIEKVQTEWHDFVRKTKTDPTAFRP